MIEATLALARNELGLDATVRWPPELSTVVRLEKIWRELATRRGELFHLGCAIGDTTPLALALHYTLHATPSLVAALVPTAIEQQWLEHIRAWAQECVGVEWPAKQHLVFAPHARPLAEVWATVTRSGVAFTFDPEFGDTALYSAAAVERWRAEPGGLVPVLLHEEAHLVAAALARGSRGPRTEQGLVHWEGAAQIVQQTAFLWASAGHEPTIAELRKRVAHVAPKGQELLASLEATAVPDVIRQAVRAAVDAALL